LNVKPVGASRDQLALKGYVFKQLVIHSNSTHCPSDSIAFLMEREREKLTLFAGLTTS